MLYLTFEVGAERFATPAAEVLEIVPVVELKRIPLAAPWVAGVFDYRGQVTPVVDLCRVFREQACSARMSTRIMVVRYGARPLGLMAERITRTVALDPDRCQDAGVSVDDAPCLGGVWHDGHDLVQLVDHTRLLPPEVAEALFRQAARTTAQCAGAQG